MLLNGLSGVSAGYTWDAENRLTKVEPIGTPVTNVSQQVLFTYDYMGRRLQKQVLVWDTSLDPDAWNPNHNKAYIRRYVWAGWLLLMELDGNNNMVRRYTWGLDLAGQAGSLNSLEGAGGIGGLLAVDQAYQDLPGTQPDVPAGQYLYFYDANGNVGQVVNWSQAVTSPPSDDWDAARLVARYEYDPYGTIIGPDTNQDGVFNSQDNPGPYTATNPFRFSTKQLDNESNLYYFGHRYYSPKMGRWLNWDPMAEAGSSNLYAYVRNDPVDQADPDGRYILGLGGASGFGDPALMGKGLRTTAKRLSEFEQKWYRDHVPCLVKYKAPDYEAAPTGLLNGLVIPDWARAVGVIDRDLGAYETWYGENSGTAGCCCLESAHLIGFSDGATATVLWLNQGHGGNKGAYGLVGIIDLVREPGREWSPNTNIEATYAVSPGSFQEHYAVRNKTPDFLINPLVIGQNLRLDGWLLRIGGWAGHKIDGWNDLRLVRGIAHTDVPGRDDVYEFLKRGLKDALEKTYAGAPRKCPCYKQ